MDTSDTRVTREQAASLAGVSPRQINRWSAAGLLTVEHGPPGAPATYDPEEILTARSRWRAAAERERLERRSARLKAKADIKS